MDSVFGFLCLLLISSYALSVDITVQTSLGNITGETEEGTFAGKTFTIMKFLGIPFAEPPTGSLRFHKPVPKGPFADTFMAKSMSAPCVQNAPLLMAVMGVSDAATLGMDEDCLHLNIYVPGQETINKFQKRTVMIWIYGGAFQIGSKDAYDAKSFVGLNDVILVTFNYRVSLLGFLSSAEENGSGNYGLWDQHMAIKWVHEHIESFGGDPQRVTIFGESAGSASVIYQALYPGNAGFFQRVIAQSGSANSPWAYQRNPRVAYKNFANKSGCLNESSSEMQAILCLRNLTVGEILELVKVQDEFLPVKDGDFIPIYPRDIFGNSSNEAWDILKQFGKLDIIIGVCSSDGAVSIPMIDIVTTTNPSKKGYSRKAFETIILPFCINNAKLKQSNVISYALGHQYFDWSDPDNEEKIFDNTVNLLSDINFNNPLTNTALAHFNSKESGNLFYYVFDHKSVFSDHRLNGATHGEDIPFVLGFPAIFAGVYAQRGNMIPQNEIELSEKMMAYWTNFAKTGDPNSVNLTHWPQYDSQAQKYILFQADKADFSVEDRYAGGRMNFWQSLVPVLELECDKTCPICEEDKVSRASFFNIWTPLLLFTLTLAVW